MKWILYIVVALVALVGMIAAVGAALPKSHVASRRARINKDAATLFAIISGPPDWRLDVKKFEEAPPVNGHRRWRETTSQDTILYELVESTPPNRYVTRIADDSLPYGGTWTILLAEENGATTVRITEEGEVRNLIFRALARYVFGYTSTMETYLKALGKKVGQDVTITE